MKRVVLAVAVGLVAAAGFGQNANPPAVVIPAVSEPRIDPVRDPRRPAIFIVGDSTVKNHGAGEGWGDYVAPFLDGARIQVLNWAMGTISS